jgi:hydrogenase expression/formation protein HypC
VTQQPLPAPVGQAASPPVPLCHDDVCVTCSDAAVAVRVRAVLDGELAVVDTEAGPEEISIALVRASPGDVVLVHAKEAIAVVEKAL